VNGALTTAGLGVDDVGRLRELCIELAESAGTLALTGRRSHGVRADTKSSPTDLVTRFDRAAEEHIRERLARHRPDDAVLGEEHPARSGTSGLEWVIDPIDGTTNFVYDLPAWCTSVAVRVAGSGSPGRIVAGAVHVPASGETFHAGAGCGASLGDRPIAASAADDVSRALVATGFAYDASRRARQGRRIAALLPRIRDVRRSGSAAYDLCSVACGRVDAYVEDAVNDWDIAAGLLICAEAGAAASDSRGLPVTAADVVVTAPGIHSALIDLLTVITAVTGDDTGRDTGRDTDE
jgi:myo-inositol-1(or 4)-monophosphatase